MNLFNVYPINNISIVKAKGSYVWDDAGQQYLDMYGGHAVISIGHTHPHYVQRLTDQLNKIGFYSNSIKIPLQEELADKLGKVSGKEDYQLFLCNSGAEANENALKLASFYNNRKKIIAFKKAFHGRTSLAVAATDNPSIVSPVNQTDNVVFLPFNDEAILESYLVSIEMKFLPSSSKAFRVLVASMKPLHHFCKRSENYVTNTMLYSLRTVYSAVMVGVGNFSPMTMPM